MSQRSAVFGLILLPTASLAEVVDKIPLIPDFWLGAAVAAAVAVFCGQLRAWAAWLVCFAWFSFNAIVLSVSLDIVDAIYREQGASYFVHWALSAAVPVAVVTFAMFRSAGEAANG